MNIEIANRLYKLRKRHGYSQEELAEKIGVSRQAVSKWERSESSPDTENLLALSKVYGVTIDNMLHEETEDYTVMGEEPKRTSETQSSYTDFEDNRDEDYEDEGEGFWKGFPIAIVATIIFFILGFGFGLWHPGWIVFMVIPVFSYFGNKKKNEEKKKKRYPWLSFPYPVLAAAIFLLIGFIWGGWVYGWIIFLTIPIWAFFASMEA